MDESALKTLLDNLEISRSSLDCWLNFWTFLVVIGVVLEVVFVIWEYVRELHDFNRGEIHPPDRPSIWLFVLGLLGAGLVAVGVSGELYVNARVGSIETDIRHANDLRAALLSKEAGDAKDSAKEAAHAAQLAKDASGDAMERSGVAKTEADSVERDMVSVKKQSADLESHLAASLQRTARLEKQLSWRTVTPEQANAIKDFLAPFRVPGPLLPFWGVKIGFSYLSDSSEAREYAEELATALRDALDGLGADISEPIPEVLIPAPIGIALQVEHSDNPLAVLLQRALKNAGIEAPGEVPKHWNRESDINFFIGVEPESKYLGPATAQ